MTSTDHIKLSKHEARTIPIMNADIDALISVNGNFTQTRKYKIKLQDSSIIVITDRLVLLLNSLGVDTNKLELYKSYSTDMNTEIDVTAPIISEDLTITHGKVVLSDIFQYQDSVKVCCKADVSVIAITERARNDLRQIECIGFIIRTLFVYQTTIKVKNDHCMFQRLAESTGVDIRDISLLADIY